MKKYVALAFLAPFTLQAKIKIEQQIEEKMRDGADKFLLSCLKMEDELSKKFSYCRVAQQYKNKLDTIERGQVATAKSNEAIMQRANDLMERIELSDEYKVTLKQALDNNTDEAWRIFHDVVYRHARELIAQESGITFPSLKKEYADMHVKLREFAQANETIDSEKMSMHMESLSLIMYHIAQMKKDHEVE